MPDQPTKEQLRKWFNIAIRPGITAERSWAIKHIEDFIESSPEPGEKRGDVQKPPYLSISTEEMQAPSPADVERALKA